MQSWIADTRPNVHWLKLDWWIAASFVVYTLGRGRETDAASLNEKL